MRIVLVLTLAMWVAGCAAPTVTSNPRSVTVVSGSASFKKVQQIAADECAKYKRFARPTIIRDDVTYVFDCVE